MAKEAKTVQSRAEKYLAWVNQIEEGDAEAENALVIEFTPIVARQVISKIGSNNDDWKDVTNDVCLTIIVNLRSGKFNSEKGQLPSYIFGIAKFKIAKYLEHSKKNLERGETFDPQASEFVSEAVQQEEIEGGERRKSLFNLMKKLKPKYREVLRLKYLEGVRVKEIATKLGYESEQKVSNLISYALQQLRQQSDKTDFFSIFLVFPGI